jgi:hypothetical protein
LRQCASADIVSARVVAVVAELADALDSKNKKAVFGNFPTLRHFRI